MLADPRIRWRALLVQSFHLLGVLGFSAAAASGYAFSERQLVRSHVVSIALFAASIALLRLTRRFEASATVALVLGLVGVALNAIEVGGLVA